MAVASSQNLSYLKRVFLFTHLTGLGAGVLFPFIAFWVIGPQAFSAAFWAICLALGFVIGALSFFYVRGTLKKQLRLQLELLQPLSGTMEVSDESVEELFNLVENAVKRVQDLIQGTFATVDEVVPHYRALAESTRYLSDRAREGLNAAVAMHQDVTAMAEKQKEVMEGLDHLSLHSQDEAALSRELSASLEEMAGAMERTRQKFQETSRIADQMTASVHRVRDQADEVIGSVEGTTKDLDAIGESLERIRWGASASSEAAGRVKSDAESGLDVVKNSMEEMERVEEESRRATEAMKRLALQTGEVAKIIEVIKELVSDTELLAFNAAIIAAKAGEEGKGFSVVAEEIRDLADRTTASAQDIHRIVKGISGDTQEVTSAVEATARRISNGKKLSQSTGEALRKIVASAGDAAGSSQQIAVLTSEQSGRAKALLEQASGSLGAVKSITRAMQEQQLDIGTLQAGVAEMRSASEQITRGMEEQVRANHEFDRGLNEREEQIRTVTDATRFQMTVVGRVFEHFNRSEQRLRKNAEKAGSITQGIADLERLAEDLRQMAEKFRR